MATTIIKSPKLIGRGTFGRVERVRDASGRIVAKKTLDPTDDALAEEDLSILRKRFIREVKIQRELGVEFVMPIIDADLDVEYPWYTMPLAECTLQEEIDNDSPILRLPNVWLDILGALEELHALTYIHRDLKPANVLLYEKRWRLADYGLVKPLSGTSSQLTKTAVTGGSFRYCSPEQYHDFRECETPTDIYSFGCILHDALIRTRRTPLQQYTSDSRIGIVIEKCTAIDPARRYKKVSLVRDGLVRALEEPYASVAPGQRDWVQSLEQADKWGVEEAQEFGHHLRHLRDKGTPEERTRDFMALTEVASALVFTVSEEAWHSIAREYCAWAGTGTFAFAYCDSIARGLQLISDLGDVRLKSDAGIAAVRLGESHHRWFVMRTAVKICGPKMDDLAAERTAIEIGAENLAGQFLTCVEQIGRQKSAYHPRIAEVLTGPSEDGED